MPRSFSRLQMPLGCQIFRSMNVTGSMIEVDQQITCYEFRHVTTIATARSRSDRRIMTAALFHSFSLRYPAG